MTRQVVCAACRIRVRLPEGGGTDYACPRCRALLASEAVTRDAAAGRVSETRPEVCPRCGARLPVAGVEVCPACTFRFPEEQSPRRNADTWSPTVDLLLGSVLPLLGTLATLTCLGFPAVVSAVAILVVLALFLPLWLKMLRGGAGRR